MYVYVHGYVNTCNNITNNNDAIVNGNINKNNNVNRPACTYNNGTN